MADRFPLILNTSNNQIQEIASGDNLDLTGSGIHNAGIITATSFSGPIVAGAGTSNIVAGIITATQIDLNGDIDVDGHTNLDNVSVAGVSTFTGNADFSSGIDVTGTITGTSHVDLPDAAQIKLGDNDEFLIYHTATGTSYIKETGSGDLYIDATNIRLRSQNGNNKLVTTSTGVDVTGNVVASGNVTAVDGTFSGNVSIGGTLTYEDVTNIDSVGIVTAREGIFIPDNKELKIGNTAASADLRIHSNGAESFADSYGGNFYIRVTDQAGGVENKLIARPNAQTELYYNDAKKLSTIGGGNSANGIEVFGNASNSAVRMSTSDGTLRGILYANSSNQIGFLGNNGNWALSVANAGGNTVSYNHFNPSTDSSLDLGTNSVRWRNVYADTLYGALTGNATSADTVDVSGAGNANTEFYVTFAETNGAAKTIKIDDGIKYNASSNVLTASYFSGNGANLSGLNGSNIASGTVPVARIGTGTKNTTTFYRGDGTFQVVNTDLVNDTSPQLGGNLDCNNKVVTLNDSTGDTNNRFKIGNGGDLQIFHASNVNYISGEVDGKDLYLRGRRDLYLQCGDNSGSHRTVLYADNNGTTRLYHPASNEVRLQTTTDGVKIGRTMFTGSTTNVEHEAVIISPSTNGGNAYHDNHIISLGQLSGNWYEGASGADTAFGLMFSYATGANAAKNLRGGIVYDHKSTEELQIWSSYGSIAFYIDSANSGNETPVTCDIKCAEFDGSGHLVPGSNDARDLGTTAKRWRNIYVNDLQLSNEAKKDKGGNDVDGTWGDWTLQEGDENIFMLNNRTGKKYKINLTEVE